MRADMRFAAGMLLAGSLVPATAVRAAAPPVDPPTFRASFLAADTVIVTRVGTTALDGRPSPVLRGGAGPSVPLARGARTRWSVRLARILAPEHGRFDARECPDAPLNAPPAPLVDVAWKRGAVSGHVQLDFRRECATFRMEGRSPASIGFAGESNDLIGLCREALPNDGTRAPQPVAEGFNTVAPWPPPGEVVPKFGDYVYVEDLPEAVTKVAPICPDQARRDGVSGTVMLQALIGSDGRVHDTRVVKSIPMLDAPADAAVRQWVFKPAMANRKPVSVWVAIPVKFSLH